MWWCEQSCTGTLGAAKKPQAATAPTAITIIVTVASKACFMDFDYSATRPTEGPRARS